MNFKSLSILTILVLTSWSISAADDSRIASRSRYKKDDRSRSRDSRSRDRIEPADADRAAKPRITATTLGCIALLCAAGTIMYGTGVAIRFPQGPTQPDLTPMYRIVNNWDCTHAQMYLLPLPEHCYHMDNNDDSKKVS